MGPRSFVLGACVVAVAWSAEGQHLRPQSETARGVPELLVPVDDVVAAIPRTPERHRSQGLRDSDILGAEVEDEPAHLVFALFGAFALGAPLFLLSSLFSSRGRTLASEGDLQPQVTEPVAPAPAAR